MYCSFGLWKISLPIKNVLEAAMLEKGGITVRIRTLDSMGDLHWLMTGMESSRKLGFQRTIQTDKADDTRTVQFTAEASAMPFHRGTSCCMWSRKMASAVRTNGLRWYVYTHVRGAETKLTAPAMGDAMVMLFTCPQARQIIRGAKRVERSRWLDPQVFSSFPFLPT